MYKQFLNRKKFIKSGYSNHYWPPIVFETHLSIFFLTQLFSPKVLLTKVFLHTIPAKKTKRSCIWTFLHFQHVVILDILCLRLSCMLIFLQLVRHIWKIAIFWPVDNLFAQHVFLQPASPGLETQGIYSAGYKKQIITAHMYFIHKWINLFSNRGGLGIRAQQLAFERGPDYDVTGHQMMVMVYLRPITKRNNLKRWNV